MIEQTMPLVVALDGGATTCRARIETGAGAVLGAATGQGANLTSDPEGAVAAVRATLEATYRAAGLAFSHRGGDVACLALAGTEAGEAGVAALQGLGFARLTVASDLDAAVEGALGGDDGIVASFGTGSFFVVQKGGTRRRAGGWGFQLSDDASGAALGRALLRRAVAARDGLAEASDLTEAVLARFDGIRAMIEFAQTASPRDYAAFAPLLAEAEVAGDPVAREILAAAVAGVEAALGRLGLAEVGRLCLVGGLAPVYGRLLSEPVARSVVAPRGSALDGAAALARGLLK